jgi:hypothetical protein
MNMITNNPAHMNFFLLRFFVAAVKADKSITLRGNRYVGKRVTGNGDKRVDGKTGERVAPDVRNKLDTLRGK